jgi:hypothetical protein
MILKAFLQAVWSSMVLPGRTEQSAAHWAVRIGRPGEKLRLHFVGDEIQEPNVDPIWILKAPSSSLDGKYLLTKTTDHHRAFLFDVSTEQWSMVSPADMLTNLHFSRNGEFVYYESTSVSHAVLMRMRISDRRNEQVMDFQNIRRPLIQSSAGWTGLANDDSPIMQRDIGA